MTYSCAYWKEATNLDQAQQHKMELIGRKLKLKPGMRVLDLGCGWGTLSKFLAETYKVQVVGVTISKEGAKEARIRCKDLPVDIRLQDYREVNDIFDRIVAIEIVEHIGRKNYRSFFELTNRCLSDDGILLIHSSGHDADIAPPCEIFVNKYIYPNGILPNFEIFCKGIHNLFCIEDLHNFGTDYEKTFLAWHENFVKNWHTIRHMYKNPETFYRMWTYALLMGAGLFRARSFQVWQIVLTKRLATGYVSVR